MSLDMGGEPQPPSAAQEPLHRRVWAQDVAVSAAVLRHRLEAIKCGSDKPLDAGELATYRGVETLLTRAENAAYRVNPLPTRFGNWWRGTLIEAAYQNLHAAEAEIVALYDAYQVDAEVPEAVARLDASLHRDDPRRIAARRLVTMPAGPRKRAALRKIVEVGYAAVDRQHSRVRSFRNIVLITATLIVVLVVTFAFVVAFSPSSVPFCFQPTPGARVCPSGTGAPSSHDVVIVVLLGLLGGALAAAVSIRNLRGTSTPYDIPVALAVLKVAAGGLTAIGGLVAIRGDFVPGLSALDSQEQILAYALVLGYAQQLLTRLIDQQAGAVLDSVPSKDSTVTRPALGDWPDTSAPTTGTALEAAGGGAAPVPA